MIIIKFSDGEIVQGGGWNSLPHKFIQKIALLGKNNKGILQDYEEYNHLIEQVMIQGSGKPSFTRAIFLMGRHGNKVDVIKYSTMTNEMSEYSAMFGQEYNGRPSTGWKKGISALNPTSKIF